MAIRMNTQQTMVVDQRKLSMQVAMMFSNTASTVVKLAVMNMEEQRAPDPAAGHVDGTPAGSKIRAGPLLASRS